MSFFDQPITRYMNRPVITVPGGLELHEAQQRLEAHNISCIGVLDSAGRLIGVLSRTDLLRIGRRRSSMAQDHRLLSLPKQHVLQYMVHPVETVTPQASVAEAAARMVERRIHRVFIVDDERAVGVFSTRDAMQAVIDARLATPIARWMSSPALTVEAADTVAQATDQLDHAHIHGLVVVEQEWPVGIYTQTEALAARSMEPDTAVDQAMSCAMLCLPVAMPMFRAAHFALATRSRRILAVETRHLRGVLSGLDMARAAAARCDAA